MAILKVEISLGYVMKMAWVMLLTAEHHLVVGSAFIPENIIMRTKGESYVTNPLRFATITGVKGVWFWGCV
jgi:hypothetical protein